MAKIDRGNREVIKDRLKALRDLLEKNKLDAYLIPSGDEYMNEYVPIWAKRLEYITGFTGSNGLALIMKNEAFFFTDGRYLNQSSKELDQNIFQILDISILENKEKLSKIFKGTLGYDPKLFTRPYLEIFSFADLKAVGGNLIDSIWKDRPKKSSTPIYDYGIEFAGLGREEKISLCLEVLSKKGADYLLVTEPDSICWLLNIRASDIEYTPVALGTLLLSKGGIIFFTEEYRVDKNILPGVEIYSEDRLGEILSSIEGKILLDGNLTSDFIISSLKKAEAVNLPSPCRIFKASKNATEIRLAEETHIEDAVALCSFLAYLENLPSAERGKLSEYDASVILNGYRKERNRYVTDSFASIVGFKDNSAVIHYRPWKDKAKKLEGEGLLLIDSGGQYKGGTTDVTRVLSLGEPTAEQKKRYTQVLKCHIALGSAKFPKGLSGGDLDVLARRYLWDEGLDFAHGTGHGVGSFLGVHEGPQSISRKNRFPLAEGMIVSNEPGYYENGGFGIRIENLVYVKKSKYPDFYEFENLTLVPYSKKLINEEELDSKELGYIADYYSKIRDLVRPKLNGTAREWLDREIGFIG